MVRTPSPKNMILGIIADIHENVTELVKRLKQAESLKCDSLACLGDITGFDRRFYHYSDSRSAGECVRLVKGSCRWVIPGNHDLFAISKAPSYSNGFTYSAGWFALGPDGRKAEARGKVWSYENEESNDLSDEEILFIAQLNEYEIISTDGRTILFSHYIYPDLTGSTTRFIENRKQMAEHWKFMNENSITHSFVAHSHNEFAGFSYRGKSPFLKAFFHIPGNEFSLDGEPSVVMVPPVSGEPGKTGFCVLDTSLMKITIIS